MKSRIALALVSSLFVASTGEAQNTQIAGPIERRADVATRVKQHFSLLDVDEDGAVTQVDMGAMGQPNRCRFISDRFKQSNPNARIRVSDDEFDRIWKACSDEKAKAREKNSKQMPRQTIPPSLGIMRADANKDGKVTEAEMLSQALARFDAMDTNKNGEVTPEERRAHWMKMQANQGGWDQYGRPLATPPLQSSPQAHGQNDGYDRAGAQTPAPSDAI